MLNQRNSRLFVTGLLLAVLPALGCAPRVFADTSGIAINGTPPPPVEEPPPPQKRVEVRDNQIVINEKVQFEYNSAKILEVSHSLLDEVAKVIKEHPQIQLIEVQGHASAEGSDDYNLKL
ncbi:MAG TPA: OmpA family protein, partial [Nannocystaceae bacterium]|nr:OmpA family protein [Nannocystaceae bacterium]